MKESGGHCHLWAPLRPAFPAFLSPSRYPPMPFRCAALLLLLLLCPCLAHSQSSAEALGEAMQTYYRQPNPAVVRLLVKHLNESAKDADGRATVQQHSASFLGFFSALAATDTTARRALRAALGQVADTSAQRLISRSLCMQPAQLLTQVPLSPAYNDMVWAAFFASGAPAYLEVLLNNCRYATERHDQTLYFTGASARWSLCAVAGQDSTVRAYLVARQSTSAEARLLLKSDPMVLRQAIMDGFKRQQHKGNGR